MNKRKIILSIFFIAYAVSAENEKIELDCVNTKRPEFQLNKLIMKHMNSVKNLGETANIGEVAGTSTNPPEKISKLFASQYKKAENLYSVKKFNEAIKELEKPISVEKENPFLWNLYARSLYAANKKSESFSAYKKLISIIDSEETLNTDGSHQLVIIDTWFLEAYWKISTLYLDAQDFNNSIYYNRKMLDVITLGNKYYDPTRIQYNVSALSYLAEAFHFLKEKEANQFYVYETLKLDRNNQYVFQFLLL